MNLTALDNVLWAASLLGHAALLVALLWRQRWRKFPVFTLLAASEAIGTITLFLIFRHGSKHAYFVAYWVSVAADYAFQLALLFEIGRTVMKPTGTWLRDAWKEFAGWSLAGLALAAIAAVTMGPQAAKGLDLWEARINVFTTILTLELFLALSMWANRLGLQWRSHVMALGQGLGIWAITAVVGDVGHVIYGWTTDFRVFDQARMVVYVGALVYWTASFALPEREKAPMSAEMEQYLLALHRRVQYDLNGAQH